MRPHCGETVMHGHLTADLLQQLRPPLETMDHGGGVTHGERLAQHCSFEAST